MVAVVGGVDDVSVVQNPVFLESGNGAFDEIVYGLKGLEAASVVEVVVLNIGQILFIHFADPACSTGLVRIEVVCAGDFGFWEQVFVSLCWNGRVPFSTEHSVLVLIIFTSVSICVRSDCRDGDEERLA